MDTEKAKITARDIIKESNNMRGNLKGTAYRTHPRIRTGEDRQYAIHLIAPGLDIDDVRRILTNKGFTVNKIINI